MGLPLRLPLKRPPRTSAPRLPPLVQPAPTTQLDRRPTTDQPRLTGLWVPHLDRVQARDVPGQKVEHLLYLADALVHVEWRMPGGEDVHVVRMVAGGELVHVGHRLAVR